MRVDVRVVAATHRDLAAMVQEGTFRADLYYRLSVLTLRVPPLRDITEDVPLLVDAFIEQLKLNCRVMSDAMAALQRYRWPGNVRELRNVLERAAVFCQNGEIRAKDLLLPDAPGGANPAPAPAASPQATPAPAPAAATTTSAGASASRSELKEIERQMILEALERNDNNKTAAARDLDMPLSTLKRRLKDYQID